MGDRSGHVGIVEHLKPVLAAAQRAVSLSRAAIWSLDSP
jgi:hypothetical protein